MIVSIPFRIEGEVLGSTTIRGLWEPGNGSRFGRYAVGRDADGKFCVCRETEWCIRVDPKELATVADVVAEAEAAANELDEERAMLAAFLGREDGCFTKEELVEAMSRRGWKWPPWTGFLATLNRLVSKGYVRADVPAGWFLTEQGRAPALGR